MANLQDIIKKRKRKRDLEENPNIEILEEMEKLKLDEKKGLIKIVQQAAEELVRKLWEQLKSKLISNTNEIISSEIKDLRENVKKGDKGDKGNSIVGPKGESIVGSRGLRGKKGDKPKAGIDFKIPEDGKQGKPGKDAEDGSPDTPQEIASKLNTLEKKVDIKVIKGLSEAIRGLERAIQSKKSVRVGGGMGDVLHQTFTGNGSITTFTLSTRVAGSGNAAWIYYNGQFLVNSTHWSISNITLTLTFTPVNGGIIDVTYIRS